MAGYTDCSCPDCFEIAIGEPGAALCHACEEAGCDGEDSCQAEPELDDEDADAAAERIEYRREAAARDAAAADRAVRAARESARRAAIAELAAAGPPAHGFCEACEAAGVPVVDMLLGTPGAFICLPCAVDGADREITPAERGEIAERIADDARLAAARRLDALAEELAVAAQRAHEIARELRAAGWTFLADRMTGHAAAIGDDAHELEDGLRQERAIGR